jgi:hypothetical protein
MNKCPFCSGELNEENLCLNCRINISAYSYYRTRAEELIEQAKTNIDNISAAIELLKHSITLDSTQTISLKLLGLLNTSIGKYDDALHYFIEYNKKIKDDHSTKGFVYQIQSWKINVERFLRATF